MRNLSVVEQVEADHQHDQDGINKLIEAVNELSREVRELSLSLRPASTTNDDPLRCPYCGSDDLWEEEPFYCYDCERTWKDPEKDSESTPLARRDEPSWRCHKCGENDRNCDCPPF